MNAINIIYPTKVVDTWIFSDKEKGLHNEPFIGETNSVIDKMIGEVLDNPEQPFQLIFSENPFPAWNYKVTHINADTFSGNWYELQMTTIPIPDLGKFWLCNALLKYFDEAPKEIYVKVEPLNK